MGSLALRRRRFLHGAAAAGLGASAWGCRTGTDPGADPGDPARPPGAAAAPPTAELTDPMAMARELLAAPRDDVPALALAWHGRGATPRDLLRVAMLAGIQEIDPSPIGGKVHAIMMVSSAAEVTTRLEGPAALLPALFNLDRVKHSQARDETEGDFTMPPAPQVEPGPAATHANALDRAMERWELAQADRAVTALHATMEPAPLFERLWPWAARDFRVIGHKAIYAAQTYRALEWLGWSHGRDALRSLVLGVLDANPYDSASERETAAILGLFEANRERRSRLPEGWDREASDPEASFAVCARLRDSDPDAAAAAVVEASLAGVAAASLWDALRLRAFEQLMHTPNIVGVHPVTAVNALHRAAVITTDDATRRLLVLQAASWLSLFDPLLREGRGRRAERRPIEALVEDAERRDRAEDPFAVADPVEAGRRAFVQVRARGPAAFGTTGVGVLVRKAGEDHDYKLAAAVLDELQAAHPHCRPYLASASLRFWPSAVDEDGDVYQAVREPLGLA